MPEDIAYNEQFRTKWDSVGDLRTVDGDRELRQSVVTALVEQANLASPALSPEGIASQQADIREVLLEAHPRIRPPIEITPDLVRETVTVEDGIVEWGDSSWGVGEWGGRYYDTIEPAVRYTVLTPNVNLEVAAGSVVGASLV